jgi:hypothetical protein
MKPGIVQKCKRVGQGLLLICVVGVMPLSLLTGCGNHEAPISIEVSKSGGLASRTYFVFRARSADAPPVSFRKQLTAETNILVSAEQLRIVANRLAEELAQHEYVADRDRTLVDQDMVKYYIVVQYKSKERLYTMKAGSRSETMVIDWARSQLWTNRVQ